MEYVQTILGMQTASWGIVVVPIGENMVNTTIPLNALCVSNGSSEEQRVGDQLKAAIGIRLLRTQHTQHSYAIVGTPDNQNTGVPHGFDGQRTF